MAREEKVVVNLSNYTGNIQTVLYDGVCPYTKKTEAAYRDEGFSVISWDEYIPIHEAYLDSLCGEWKEITEERFDEQLNVLPPLRWTNGGFYMSELYTANVTGFYQKWHGKCYTSLQRLSTPRQSVLDSLQAFIDRNAA
jgi:hypothetical protein